MKAWKTVKRERVYEAGRFLAVERHEVELPDGRVIGDWAWVVTPDYVNVLAETVEGKFLCFRQTKYAVEGVTLAPIGGYVEEGEEPGEAAKREMMEEAGYEAAEWIGLGTYVVDANRGAGRAHLFLAKQARRVAEPVGGDLEEQELLMLSRGEMERALAEGQFKVLAWATVVALGLRMGAADERG